MSSLAAHPARILVSSICVVVLTVLFASAAYAGTGPRNVCIVANVNSLTSAEIAEYYASARGIPLRNICWVSCSTAESVAQTECEDNIVAPIRAFLSDPAMAQIDFIVLTKGVPLKANYGYSSGALSITSILTCVSEPWITAYIENPYGPISWDPVECAFSHQLELCGMHMYLVTRLDGYTKEDVFSLIDRSLTPSPLGPILLDQKYLTATSGPEWMLNERLAAANGIMLAKGIPTIFDSTSAFLANQSGLMGYFSWGSNDPSFATEAYRSNTLVPGSLADTFVSTSARTFTPQSTGQSLIVDLINQGACGLSGFVSEPYNAFATYPQVLFDRYTKGYNMAESFYAATPMLYWKSTVIGDPLMAPYATVPEVHLEFPSVAMTGTATIDATASDPDGIAKVEFFFDGEPIGACAEPPYSVIIDTTQFPVGKHTIEARATDAGIVATEGSAFATVEVMNEVSMIRVISQAYPNPESQIVRILPKVVIAGTEEMGGDEFYICEPDGGSGLRIQSSVPLKEGDMVGLLGWLVTLRGERTVQADELYIQPTTGVVPNPRAMPNRVLGGADICPETKGVTGGTGARNIGLLVKTWGTTTYVGGPGENYFYIDDGSGASDGSGRVGVKVATRGLIKPPLGANVIVTGISSCEELGDRIVPMLKVRRQSDIKVVAG